MKWSLSTEPKKGRNGAGLTIDLIQKFSRQACQYILAYYHLEHDTLGNNEDALDLICNEEVRKSFKTHRSAIDFDEKFIKHATSTATDQSTAPAPDAAQQE